MLLSVQNLEIGTTGKMGLKHWKFDLERDVESVFMFCSHNLNSNSRLNMSPAFGPSP
jgi:hypothetical protein